MMSKNSKSDPKWYSKYPVASIGLSVYVVLQVITFVGMLDADLIQKFTPSFFATILLLISTNSVKRDKEIDELKKSQTIEIEKLKGTQAIQIEELKSSQTIQIEELKISHITKIEELKSCFAQGRIEHIDQVSDFFERLTYLIKNTSTVDVFHVSDHPLTLLNRPQAESYLDKTHKFICDESQCFLMRRLFVLDASQKAKWVSQLYEKYQDYNHTYLMRIIETPINPTFMGYVLIDRRYSFLILPRPQGASIKVIFIESKSVNEVLLHRYDELWKLGTIVDKDASSRHS